VALTAFKINGLENVEPNHVMLHEVFTLSVVLICGSINIIILLGNHFTSEQLIIHGMNFLGWAVIIFVSLL